MFFICLNFVFVLLFLKVAKVDLKLLLRDRIGTNDHDTHESTGHDNEHNDLPNAGPAKCACFAIACALYYGVERPFLLIKNHIKPGGFPWPTILIWSVLLIGTVRYFSDQM